jgi:pimeloyl-ACP methyl ester carboxylesterase
MKFSVGYHEFSKDKGLNFQLNRFYSSGTVSYNELLEIGNKVTGFDEWIRLFTELAEDAEKKGEYLKAAQCYRAAQFYTLGDKTDEQGRLMKKVLYEKCRKNYDLVYGKVDGLVYDKIPYGSGYLPVYYMRPQAPKGTIVICGGYDSFVQEFMELVFFFHEKNYAVYFFEGPGQGEVLYRCNMKMNAKWENCTSAVLNHYNLHDVTMIGISLGGYLATRAAAFESRISKLVMYDLIYDFYGSLIAKMGKVKSRFFNWMVKSPKNPFWKIINKKLDEIYFTKWLLLQGYEIFENVSTPYEYFNHIKQYNTREISSLIKQDTLVLAGESDIYTIYYEDQLKALTNAKSVTGRIFTKEENADHHCQVGNLGLVLDTIYNWIEGKGEYINGKESNT